MALENPSSQHWSQACTDAVRTTAECTTWCLQNDPTKYTACIRHCLDAGTLAHTAATLVWREGPHAAKTFDATATVLEACADMCSQHKDVHDVMARCATTCREAANACRTVAEQV